MTELSNAPYVGSAGGVAMQEDRRQATYKRPESWSVGRPPQTNFSITVECREGHDAPRNRNLPAQAMHLGVHVEYGLEEPWCRIHVADDAPWRGKPPAELQSGRACAQGSPQLLRPPEPWGHRVRRSSQSTPGSCSSASRSCSRDTLGSSSRGPSPGEDHYWRAFPEHAIGRPPRSPRSPALVERPSLSVDRLSSDTLEERVLRPRERSLYQLARGGPPHWRHDTHRSHTRFQEQGVDVGSLKWRAGDRGSLESWRIASRTPVADSSRVVGSTRASTARWPQSTRRTVSGDIDRFGPVVEIDQTLRKDKECTWQGPVNAARCSLVTRASDGTHSIRVAPEETHEVTGAATKRSGEAFTITITHTICPAAEKEHDETTTNIDGTLPTTISAHSMAPPCEKKGGVEAAATPDVIKPCGEARTIVDADSPGAPKNIIVDSVGSSVEEHHAVDGTMPAEARTVDVPFMVNINHEECLVGEAMSDGTVLSEALTNSTPFMIAASEESVGVEMDAASVNPGPSWEELREQTLQAEKCPKEETHSSTCADLTVVAATLTEMTKAPAAPDELLSKASLLIKTGDHGQEEPSRMRTLSSGSTGTAVPSTFTENLSLALRRFVTCGDRSVQTTKGAQSHRDDPSFAVSVTEVEGSQRTTSPGQERVGREGCLEIPPRSPRCSPMSSPRHSAAPSPKQTPRPSRRQSVDPREILELAMRMRTAGVEGAAGADGWATLRRSYSVPSETPRGYASSVPESHSFDKSHSMSLVSLASRSFAMEESFSGALTPGSASTADP